MEKNKVIEAIKEIRKQEKRKFEQAVDMIVNLKSFDIKKDSVNLFINLPYKTRDVQLCAFLNKASNIVDSVTKLEFDSYKDKRKIKKLVKDYDFFVSSASLMPVVASSFGKYLGPAGKMPSPQLGIIREETEKEIQETIDKFSRAVRIKSKEPSLKFSVGKENMKDENIAENILLSYNTILNALPKTKENIRNVMIKFTMGKPIKLRI